MRLLIDTHILIWFLECNNLLSKSHHRTITSPDSYVFVSIASLWEMAIKISVGKLTLASPLADVLKAGFNAAVSSPRSVRPNYYRPITD